MRSCITEFKLHGRESAIDKAFEEFDLDRTGLLERAEVAVLMAQAARALTYFHRAPGAERKKAVQELIQVYTDLNARCEKLDEDDPDVEVEIGFNRVEMPLLQALHALCGEQFETPEEWQSWWATHKNEDWQDDP